MVEIHYTRHFERAYKKMPRSVKTVSKKSMAVFRENPFAPSLETHKLSGKLKGFWSFSITQKHRILFKQVGNSTYAFHDIGDHDIYK